MHASPIPIMRQIITISSYVELICSPESLTNIFYVEHPFLILCKVHHLIRDTLSQKNFLCMKRFPYYQETFLVLPGNVSLVLPGNFSRTTGKRFSYYRETFLVLPGNVSLVLPGNFSRTTKKRFSYYLETFLVLPGNVSCTTGKLFPCYRETFLVLAGNFEPAEISQQYGKRFSAIRENLAGSIFHGRAENVSR
jgi:hypothetical protein